MRESLPPGVRSHNCFCFPDLPERVTMRRGKILRDPRTGPGLLMIDGRQYWFGMEGIWKSEAPPQPGLAVDVELDRTGQVLAITAVPESTAAKHSKRPVNSVKDAGLRILQNIASKCGMYNLFRRREFFERL